MKKIIALCFLVAFFSFTLRGQNDDVGRKLDFETDFAIVAHHYGGGSKGAVYIVKNEEDIHFGEDYVQLRDDVSGKEIRLIGGAVEVTFMSSGKEDNGEE